MKGLFRILFAGILVSAALASTPDIPLSDTRLTVHTLVREDVFAGLLADDLDRLARAEKNLEILLEQRPADRHVTLAWKGSTKMYRAIRALEAKQNDEFKRSYQQAIDLFAEARKLNSTDGGVAAVNGGTFVLLADRLPKELQPTAWETAYANYKGLWAAQSGGVDKLPVHLRGELLAGLAQSAQRTGRKEEMTEYVDKILTYMRGTPYEAPAARWKSNPESAATSNIACKNCHEAGRLAARLASFEKK